MAARSLHRSLLFVPALRPDRFVKATRSGADVMCIDLEDAVPTMRKAEARALALPYLTRPDAHGARRFLRVNSPRSLEGVRDVLALVDGDATPDGLVVPKVETADEIRWLAGLLPPRLSRTEILPIVETADGLREVDAIVDASSRVSCLAFGFVDYAAQTGCDMSWDALLYARGRVVAAAARRTLDAIDGPWLALDDDQGLREEAGRVATLGFTGKMAIHPRQVAGIHAAFAPSLERVREAQRIVDVFESAGGQAFAFEGRMVDAPVVVTARRVLAAAAQAKLGGDAPER